MRVKVPSTDFEILPLGLGGNTFGAATNQAESETILNAFTEGGGSFIDTADSYSAWIEGHTGGESETVLGKWMRDRKNRQEVIIGTKVGSHPEFRGLDPANIKAAAEASLRRLRTDYIDLYYSHIDEKDRPIEEIARAFDELVREGKVRYIAASNMQPDRIEAWLSYARAEGLTAPIALQPEYNLVYRSDYESGIAPVAAEHDLAVFPYYGIASGFLTGKYRSEADLEGSRRGGAVKKFLNDDGLRVVDAIEAIANDHGVPMASVALAWLVAQPTITAPLASATSVQQLDELLQVAELKLSDDELERLDRASQPYA